MLSDLFPSHDNPSSRIVRLPRFSNHFDISAFIKVKLDYVNTESPFDFINMLDKVMAGVPSLLISEYPIYDIAGILIEEFNNSAHLNYRSPLCTYDESLYYKLESLALKDEDMFWPECSVDEIVPTSGDVLSNLGKGIAGSVYGAYHFTRLSSEAISQILTRWTIDAILLVSNFNIHTLILTFVKILNEVCNLPNLLTLIYNLFKSALSTFNDWTAGIGSKQPLPEIQPTADDGIVEDLLTYKPIS